jgi:beta-glucanase (GH16 family)
VYEMRSLGQEKLALAKQVAFLKGQLDSEAVWLHTAIKHAPARSRTAAAAAAAAVLHSPQHRSVRSTRQQQYQQQQQSDDSGLGLGSLLHRVHRRPLYDDVDSIDSSGVHSSSSVNISRVSSAEIAVSNSNGSSSSSVIGSARSPTTATRLHHSRSHRSRSRK